MSSYKRKKTFGDTDWFVHDRFGMFIHFGIYALPARGEWVKHTECTSEEAYQRYFDHFDPDLFDAKEWASYAKKAGMKYAVLTAKHHDGFCLFDSKFTDYKITNTPFGRDLAKEFADAFRAEGIRVGFYYSLQDWHHPDFPIDFIHPRRSDPDAAEQDKGRDMKKYAKYMRDQITELLSNYGDVDILWFDFVHGSNWFSPEVQAGRHAMIQPWMQYGGLKTKDQYESEELIKTARKLRPGIIIDNRAGIEQDIATPEKYQPTEWPKTPDGEYLTWETCQTFSGAWGYHRDEMTWKSGEMLVNMLVDTVSVGGNLIMNVGPTARGYFDYRAEDALKTYADWMKYNSRSIYGCTMAEPELKAPYGCKLTQSEDGKRLYIHLQKYPFEELKFPGLETSRIEYAQFLADGSEVLYKEIPHGALSVFDTTRQSSDYTGTVFMLPVVKPHGLCPVIEVYLR